MANFNNFKKNIMKNNKGVILTMLVAAATLVSCNQGENNKLKIGYLPIAECLPLYVAQEKGFFEKYGLEVELVSESGGPTVFRDLEANIVQIGFSNVVTLINQNNAGMDYKSIFGATYETSVNNNHAIISRRDSLSKISSAAKYCVNARNNIEELMLLNYLNKNGIPINNDLLTHIVAIPFPQMLLSLRDKSVDFACIVEPSITISKNDSIFKYIGDHYPVNDFGKVLVATYVAQSKTIKERKEYIDKFILAMTEATNYVNTNNIDARDFIKKYSKIDDKLLSQISLSEFTDKIDESYLDKIIKLMYNDTLNFNKSFIQKPETIILPSSLIYKKDE